MASGRGEVIEADGLADVGTAGCGRSVGERRQVWRFGSLRRVVTVLVRLVRMLALCIPGREGLIR